MRHTDAAVSIPGAGQDKWALALHPWMSTAEPFVEVMVTEHGQDMDSVPLDRLGVTRLVQELTEWLADTGCQQRLVLDVRCGQSESAHGPGLGQVDHPFIRP